MATSIQDIFMAPSFSWAGRDGNPLHAKRRRCLCDRTLLFAAAEHDVQDRRHGSHPKTQKKVRVAADTATDHSGVRSMRSQSSANSAFSSGPTFAEQGRRDRYCVLRTIATEILFSHQIHACLVLNGILTDDCVYM
jgi:hypothetical protein